MISLFMNDKFRIVPLIEFGGEHIYWDAHYDPEYHQICSNHMDGVMRRFIIKMVVMFSGITVAFIGPFYAYFVRGLKTTTIEAKIPFAEPGSDAEFLGNVVIQFVLAIMGAFVYFGLEVTMALFENVVTIAPDLIELEMKQLCTKYQRRLITESEMRLRFRNVVQQVLDSERC